MELTISLGTTYVFSWATPPVFSVFFLFWFVLSVLMHDLSPWVTSQSRLKCVVWITSNPRLDIIILQNGGYCSIIYCKTFYQLKLFVFKFPYFYYVACPFSSLTIAVLTSPESEYLAPSSGLKKSIVIFNLEPKELFVLAKFTIFFAAAIKQYYQAHKTSHY